VRGGKSNKPIEPVVGNILIPAQRNHALCVEIANGNLLYGGSIENRGHQRDAQAGSCQRESTIVLIRLIDHSRAYSSFCQKLRRAVEGFAMSPKDEALAGEIG
jgi:hypothetical protein